MREVPDPPAAETQPEDGSPADGDAAEDLPAEIDAALLRKYFTLTDGDVDQVARCRGAGNKLGFGVQLCALRWRGHFLADPRAVPPLIAGLKDESPDVREQVAFALGQIRDVSAVDPLVAALKDTNAEVREQVAFALGQLRDPRAVDALMAALKDQSADVRRQAAFALGQLAR